MLSKGHRRKQQIVDTAKDMFIQNGFQSTHIGKVCEILNIARGTVYQYFGNKREILYAILEAVEEKIEDVLDFDDFRDYLKNDPPEKSIFTFVSDRMTECIKTMLSEPIVSKLIFRDIIGIDDDVVNRINLFIDHVSKRLIPDIEELNKRNMLRKDINAENSVLMLIGGVLFIIRNFESRGTVLNDTQINDLVSEYLKGLFKFN